MGAIAQGGGRGEGTAVWWGETMQAVVDLCWKKYVNRAKEHKQPRKLAGQPRGSQNKHSLFTTERVAGVSAFVDSNSLSRTAACGINTLTLNKQEITIMKCTGRHFMLLFETAHSRSADEYLSTLNSPPAGLFISASCTWELSWIEDITYYYTQDLKCKFAISNSFPWELWEALLCELQIKH